MELSDKHRWNGTHCANEKYIRSYARHMAPKSERQMPLFSHVGRGLRGDAFIVEIEDGGFVGKKRDSVTGEDTVEWQLPFSAMSPQLHYQMWECVREIDEDDPEHGRNPYWYGYYIKYRYAVNTPEDGDVTLWEMETPVAFTKRYTGREPLPEDRMIDTDEED